MLKVSRPVVMDVNRYEIGDKVHIVLGDVNYIATAIEEESDGSMLFWLDDCLNDKKRPMNIHGGTEGRYDGSDMRKFLQQLSKTIPNKIKKQMVPFNNGDILRLLSLREVTGEDARTWDKIDGQIEYLKDRRHRIKMFNGADSAYWLSAVVSSAGFAGVSGDGGAGYVNASNARGVVPAFKLKNNK